MAGGGDMGLGDLGMGLGDVGSGASSMGGGGGGDPFSGDPTLTGGDPMSGMNALMSGGSPDGAFGGPPGGSSNPPADPQVGAEQSQAPQPGTSPTSFGGQQSGPQTNAQLDQIIKSLSGLHNQASPLEAAAAQGQGYGGGPTGTSTGMRGTAESSFPESSFAQQPGQLGPRDGFGGGSPAQSQDTFSTASNTTTPPSTPKGNVPIGATAQPIPPSDSMTPTPPSSTSPGQPTPDEAAQIPKLGQTDTTDKTGTKPDTTQTKPDTTATPPATSTGPVSSRGTGATPTGQQGYGGGSPGQQQQMTPAKLIGDILQAMFGNPAPLLHDLAGQAGAAQHPPGAGGAGQPRAGGRNAGGGVPPQTDTKTPTIPPAPTPSVPQQQGDVQAAIGKGERDPFGQTGWPQQGDRDPLAPTAGRQGGPVSWQQIATMGPETHAQNFNQPFNANLRNERAAFFQYADTHPAYKQRLFDIMGNEQSSHPQGTQAVLESLVNRFNSEHLGLNDARTIGWYQQGGYYDHGGGRGNQAVLEQSYQNVKNGANISDYATDNASNTPTRNAAEGLARREVQTGRFRNQSQYGGEWLQSPGSEGNRPRYEEWRNRMDGPTIGPRSALPSPNRVTGLDLLQGNQAA